MCVQRARASVLEEVHSRRWGECGLLGRRLMLLQNLVPWLQEHAWHSSHLEGQCATWVGHQVTLVFSPTESESGRG